MRDAAEWLDYGIARGWCSPTYCHVHDGPPMTDDEIDQAETEGEPPCITAVRLDPPT